MVAMVGNRKARAATSTGNPHFQRSTICVSRDGATWCVAQRSCPWRLVTNWQLSRRGWAHQDTWDLNLILARRLGAQLTNVAETTNGWPGPEKYDSPQAWDRALRSAGTALTVYALDDRSIHRRNEAKDALHWVADNLEHLWW